MVIKMKNSSKILLGFMLVMMICCVSAVSATDINGTDDTLITDAIAVDDVSEIVEEVEIDDATDDVVEEANESITNEISEVAGTSKTTETAEEIEAEHKERLSPFAFSKCNISPSEVIEWYNDPAMTFVVLDDKNVEYKGRPYSLSALASLLTGI